MHGPISSIPRPSSPRHHSMPAIAARYASGQSANASLSHQRSPRHHTGWHVERKVQIGQLAGPSAPAHPQTDPKRA